MSGHDDGFALVLAPEERGGEMDRIEGAELGRQRLCGARQHLSGHFDDLEAFYKPEYRFTTPCELAVGERRSKAQPVEAPEAFRLDERARHAGADRPPLGE